MLKKRWWMMSAVVVMVGAGTVMAKVTPKEADKLKSTLTPFGSERAGNAEGTIPKWTGGLTRANAPSGWKAPAGHRPDPYPDDKVLFTITAANMGQYANKLSEGQQTLFSAYPKTFKMHVYPSRRSHAVPDWIAINTFNNATKAELINHGDGIRNAFGGYPFPIPKNGNEAIWNHLTSWRGSYLIKRELEAVVFPNGNYTRADYDVWMDNRFYQTGGSCETLNNELYRFMDLYASPPSRAGDAMLILETLNSTEDQRKTWLYNPGERRVHRASNIIFDTPHNEASTYDDYMMYNGSPERYNWKLIGKREVYIPYNNYKVGQPHIKFKEVLTPYHPNPNLLRYELHRVWVVEATLKKGFRHIYSKRVMYIDEDSWLIACADSFDNNGKLWRVGLSYLKTFYDVPTAGTAMNVYHDIISNTYGVYGLDSEYEKSTDFSNPSPDASFFTPQALRRRGHR